jgi:hypothetical protein
MAVDSIAAVRFTSDSAPIAMVTEAYERALWDTI